MASILILGGGVFLGKHVTTTLLSRGHQVTHFNRGRSGTAPAGAATILGDRRFDLASAGSTSWDAIVDTSGYVPRDVEIASRYFAQRAKRYLFVSTISVYDASFAPIDEDSPTVPLAPEADRTRVNPEIYGALKAGCEAIVTSTYRQRATIVRPGLIVGPDDPTDRFTAWPLRFARGGDVLVPESPTFATQFVDVRDLAAFIVHALERDLAGIYNVTSPRGAHTLGAVFSACIEAARVPTRLRWATPEFLQRHEIGAWIDMPLWIPASAGEPGMLAIDVRRALVAGLQLRSLEQTVRDTLAWTRTWPRDRSPHAGLTPQREDTALAALAR
ncbi:MAG TPA: NAD-dependent epimerase/dehydratase family protein [Verrucomicrobiae bacterium]|jgi:2'-hydroxyisoflavone reductase|nr:NAD-dependent epimerase/dehydratase family protein [Verrucomicrobiae bacterium]